MADIDGGTPSEGGVLLLDGGALGGYQVEFVDYGSYDYVTDGGTPLKLPVGISTVDVFGQLLTTTGAPAVGSVEWLAPEAVAYPGEDVTVLPSPVEVTLDPTGFFVITLPPGDDPAGNPSGWSYLVSEKMAGGRKRTIFLSGDTPVHDYAELVAAPSSTVVPTIPTVTYYTVNILDGGTP